MILLNQYRAQIGLWDAFCSKHRMNKNRKTTKGKTCTTHRPVLVLILLILLLSGDVHPNPGPDNQKKLVDICHINARSLMSLDKDTQSHLKFDEIVSKVVHQLKSDIICVSESWLDNTISNKDIEIIGYSPFRKDRNRHGGGVLIYVSDCFIVKRRSDLEHDDIESVWVELNITGKKILLASYYRAPLSRAQRPSVIDNFVNKFQSSVVDAIMENPDCLVVVGDFNDRCKQWDDSHPDSEIGTKLLDVTNTLNLFQIICEPTRYTATSANILDLIITDSPGQINKVEVIPPIHNLDHCIISCRLGVSHMYDKVFYRQIWNYDQADYVGLNESLSENLNRDVTITQAQNIDECLTIFNSILLEYMKQYIPNRTIKVRPRDKPYITHVCRMADRDRDRWHKKFQRTKNPDHYEIFKEKRRVAKATRKEAKLRYQNRLVQKLSADNANRKDYWKLVKSMMGAKVKPGIPIINTNDTYSVTATEKATVFNAYFASQARLDVVPAAMPPLYYTTTSKLSVIKTTPEEVESVLRAIDLSKATGPDEISGRVLKHISSSISEPLSNYYNHSFEQGKVPLQWKKANVIPVYKKGDRQLVKNYRPISLLCIAGKIQERIVFKTLYTYCFQHRLLTWRNSGFKPLDSAINQLLMVVHNIYIALENGHDVCMVYLDISKAFDRVWHTGLIHKMKMMGITGKILLWLTDYLHNRLQRVVINGSHSTWVEITAGVPQGSILGPLLFLVYVNDIVIDINSDILLYADDTILMRVITDPAQDIRTVNNDLENLNKWAQQWAISFSPSKSEHMIISKRTNHIHYDQIVLDSTVVERVARHSHLGLVITETMSWEPHIRSRIEKAAPTLNLLVRNTVLLPRHVKETIYKTFIRPVLEYGCVIYDNCPSFVSHLLEHSQRTAGLACTGAYRDTSHSSLLNELGWPSLSKRRDFYKLCQMYKLCKNVSPNYLLETFPTNMGEQHYNLRNNDQIRIPFTRTAAYSNSFYHSTVKLWNELEASMRNCHSLHIFKCHLKRSLFPQPNHLYLYGYGKCTIHLARMRMGLSPLNQHRHNYNYIPNAHCNLCGHRSEDCIHFFLECVSYQVARNLLLLSVAPLVVDIFPDIYSITTLRDKKAFVNILLSGDARLNDSSNREIFNYVFQFIEASNRMK